MNMVAIVDLLVIIILRAPMSQCKMQSSKKDIWYPIWYPLKPSPKATQWKKSGEKRERESTLCRRYESVRRKCFASLVVGLDDLGVNYEGYLVRLKSRRR